jgi:serine/threonine-protein kinase
MLRPDDVLANYRVVRHLGGGSSAEVFEVEHLTLGSRHALKVLNRQWVEDPELRGRFLAEGRMLAGLRSPHLVRVTDTLAEPGVAALVMDRLEGETLRDRLERDGALPVDEAVRITRGILDGLAVAHGAGIVHRDVKPENLFLTADGPVLIDFGIAKGPGGDRTTQRAMGTCAYMSPEQVRDTANVDARSDLFSLGAVLWEMLTGSPAFEGPTAFASMEAVLAGPTRPPSADEPAVPGWLDAAVMEALAVDPRERIPSAAAFHQRLDERSPAPPEEPAPVVPVQPERPARPAPTGWSAGRVLFVLLAGIAAMTLLAGAGVATLAWIYRPATVRDLSVVSDDCGQVVVEADVRARDAELTVTVDGRSIHQAVVQGRQPLITSTRTRRGRDAEIVVALGRTRKRVVHRVQGTEPRLGLVGGTAGQPLRAELVGTCLPKDLRYEGQIGSQAVGGPLAPGQPLTLPATDLPPGRHAVELRVLDGDRVVTMANRALLVGGVPPADDQDMDGVPAPRDCDDQDPRVSPDQPEAAFPNGRDDDCDGLVDEGTIAFDDDGDGLSERDGDCDDADPDVRPGARELPDCRDQDCDGAIDEGVERPQVDDVYAPNRTRETAYDLRTGDKTAFTQTLDLVFADAQDASWFRFHSDDGSFDAWSIEVHGETLPAETVFDVQVVPLDGRRSGATRIRAGSAPLVVTGRGFADDSGDYLLHIQPVDLPRPWCPARWVLRSR